MPFRFHTRWIFTAQNIQNHPAAIKKKYPKPSSSNQESTMMQSKTLNARPNYANIKSYLLSRRLLARVRTSKRKEIIQRVDSIIEDDDYFSELMEKLELDDDTVATKARGSKRKEIIQRVDNIIENDDSFSQLIEKIELDDDTVATDAMGGSFSSLSTSSFSLSEEDEQKQIHHAVWVWSSGNLQEEPDCQELQETFFGGVAIIKNSSGRVRIDDETMLPGIQE
jgi:hypothetical protein